MLHIRLVSREVYIKISSDFYKTLHAIKYVHLSTIADQYVVA